MNRFAVDLLQQTRSTMELNTILNYNPDPNETELKLLARLQIAIECKQKKFVAHSHIQQFLAAIW